MSTDRLNAEVQRLRERGVALPRNPRKAAATANEMANMSRYAQDNLGLGLQLGRPIPTADSDIQRIMQENKMQSRTFSERRGSMQKTAGDVGSAIPRFYDPLEFWDISGLPWNVANEGHRHKLHKWLRLYYATHYLVASLVDIFTKFPLMGLNLESKDPQIQDFYETLFLDQLNYPDFLVNLGREFWTVGEAFPLGSFDENLGVWEREELLNPEDVVIEQFPFLGTEQLKVSPPDYLKKLVQTKSPPREWRMLEINFPELIPYLMRGENIPVSNTLLKQVGNKLNAWDEHGTPILLRGLRTLLHEEKLLASQDAIAERLYSPLILAKAGIMDFGDGQPPWIPGPEELDAIRDDFDIALASDFRLIVHNVGLEVSNVFGREQMPRLGDDFDRVERRLMQVFGVNPSLLSAGASTQPYASSALQAEFLNQTLKTFQNRLIQHYKERAYVVAEAQGHYAYETRGKTRIPIMEHVVEVDPDGTKRVIEKPKLMIPDMKFHTLDLRDEATERQFLQSLRGLGVPIPNSKLSVGIDWDIKDMVIEYNKELKEQTIAQQRAKFDTYTALKLQGLPIPADLKAEVESVLNQGDPNNPGSAPTGAGGPGGGPGGPGGGGAPEGGTGPPGGIVVPPPPDGLQVPGLGPGGAGGTPSGGGPPPASPMAPGPAGSVPQVSNERRPGLTYNTHVESSTEDATIDDVVHLSRHQELVDEGTDDERIVESMPKPPVHLAGTDESKKYSIIEPDASPDQSYDVSEQAFASVQIAGGVTISAQDGTIPATGFAFSPDKSTEVKVPTTQFTLQDVQNYVNEQSAALHLPDNFLGAWTSTDEEDGIEYVYLDVSQVLPDINEALRLAEQAEQKAIYNLETYEEIPVNQTTGDNLDSAQQTT